MNTEFPLVSILMVTYNSEKFVRGSIESILAQTYPHFELIICDDNSTDKTWNIICSYEDKRIVSHQNDTNLREYPNRNKAISLAKGEYVIFIDGDDLIYPGGLQFLIQFAVRYRDCAIVIARSWDERIVYPKRITPHQFYCFEYLDQGICGINFTKLLFKASVVRENLFPNHVKLGDVYIQYLIASRNNVVVVPDAATWWRRNAGQASERLLRDYSFYLTHELWIKLEMLGNRNCPLTDSEKEIAYDNVYGNYLRFQLKQLLKARFKAVIGLLKRYPIPRNRIRAIFVSQKRNYFSSVTGANPLRDKNV